MAKCGEPAQITPHSSAWPILHGQERVQYRCRPGKYALYTIPGLTEWTIIFSRDTNLWGAYGYREQNDVVRIKVPAAKAPFFAESFTISFDEVEDEKLEVSLHWADTKVSFPLKVDIKDRVIANVQRKTSEEKDDPDWGTYWRGANYLLRNNGDLALADRWIDSSLAITEYWMNAWTKAAISAARGQYKVAVVWAEKALAIGLQKDQKMYFPYEGTWRRYIAEWQKEIK